MHQMKNKYIVKSHTWYDEGTEAYIIEGPFESLSGQWALFGGLRNGDLDEETCNLDEFEIINEE